MVLAEATFPEHVPADAARYLSSARQAGQNATKADVRRLLLTHLSPGTAPGTAEDAARRFYSGEIAVAHSGLIANVD